MGFNTISITIGLLLIQPFTALIILVAGHADVARQIAHAHMLFNMAGVLLFAPLLPLCQRLLETWLPEQQTGTCGCLIRRYGDRTTRS